MVTGTTLLEMVPQRLKRSYEEYLEIAAEAQIVEWVDGEVIIYMPPLYEHQDIVSFLDALLRQFAQFFDSGVVIPAPFEVKLWPDGPAREPDIIFVRNENRSQLTSRRFEGAPDLIIEVVSPGSITEDRVHKFREYEQAGVREYWIIDPRRHQQQADFYILGDDGLFQSAPIDDQGIYHSTVIPRFWLDISWLWQGQLPNPQAALAEIMLSVEGLPANVRSAYEVLYNSLTRRH